jgi:hypothetical protein
MRCVVILLGGLGKGRKRKIEGFEGKLRGAAVFSGN